MKQLYICEKCGKQFEDYNEAYACEINHRTIDGIRDGESFQTWKSGTVAPETITAYTSEWNSEKEEIVQQHYIYKLVRPCNAQELAAIEKRKQEEEEAAARWRAEYEKEKAERAARQTA